MRALRETQSRIEQTLRLDYETFINAAFFLQGKLIEEGPGKQLFTNPHDKRTEDYVTGRFG